jgi:hypothetical protein
MASGYQHYASGNLTLKIKECHGYLESEACLSESMKNLVSSDPSKFIIFFTLKIHRKDKFFIQKGVEAAGDLDTINNRLLIRFIWLNNRCN